LACEYGKHNVRVNCIAPGLVKTDFARALWENPETLKASTARSPLLRIGEPDEIAGAAVFLAARAGTFMTGQTIVIDGGATVSLGVRRRKVAAGSNFEAPPLQSGRSLCLKRRGTAVTQVPVGV